jgi:ATP-dependent exoDNAse (exonuclease V) beta subunit
MMPLFGDPEHDAPPRVPLGDQADRDIVRDALDENLVVEAAAGTGKTTELVKRIVNVLGSGRAAVTQIVAVTFTEKAAGELKLRLRKALEEDRRTAQNGGIESARRVSHVEAALASLEEAHVSTIHGFCAELLRERPVEAGVDPAFVTLAEADARQLFDSAFDGWLQAELEHPGEGIRRSLRRRSGYDHEGPAGRLAVAAWALTEFRDFPEPWRTEPFDRVRAIDRLVPEVHAFAELTQQPGRGNDRLYQSTGAVRRLSTEIAQNEAVRPRDYDGLEASFVALARDRDFSDQRPGAGKNYSERATRADVLDRRAALLAALLEFARNADGDLAARLQHELAGCLEAYERLKRRNGRLDFVDLLVKARDLVRDSVAVRKEFQRRFTHIFVDEFQDTDPLQAELLLLLSANDSSNADWLSVTPAPGKLFVVADPKQSIYRFRRADVGVYQDVKKRLVEQGARVVHLRTSFRAPANIQRLVNAAFAPLMTGDTATLQPEYVSLESCRPEIPGRPSVVVLPVPEPYGAFRITNRAIEGSLPDAVGAFVHWLIEKSGWQVTERDRPGQLVDVAARHVCLLFRRFEYFGRDVTREYVDALEARGVPHLLVGGKSFHRREEVETIRASLSAIEWPDDELAVFATLRGSLFAVTDEALLEYRHRYGHLHPFRPAREQAGDEPLSPSLVPIADALDLLRQLHRERNYRPITETIGRLMEATRAHASFVLRPSGQQALANVLQIAELARRYEHGGGISFRGFVDQLEQEAESGEAPEAPILEEASDGVRLMTVHRAKGLEFPVVVLVDITAKLARDQASRYVDARRKLCAIRIAGWSPLELLDHEAEEVARDRAEGIRLAYVAATRARDLLVVPAVGDEPHDEGWINALNGAIYPSLLAAPAQAPGCPPFGTDSVVRRPDEVMHARGVPPGLHVFSSSQPDTAYSVVWWDPNALELGIKPSFGARYEQLIVKDVSADVVETDRQAYDAWRAGHDDAIRQGCQPSLIVRTATEQAAVDVRAGTADDAADLPDTLFRDVEVVEVPGEPNRPSGLRHGTLVHAVLALTPLDAASTQFEEVAQLQGRILGATGDEAVSAARIAQAVFAHPLIRRAARAERDGRCRRETPVTLRQPDGALVEGVVDLAFREDGRWTVVDFKTDLELSHGLPLYRQQVGLYARAIATATGEPVTAILMRI